VTFAGIINPAEDLIDTTFDFEIQVFREWDDFVSNTAGEPSQMLTRSLPLALGPLRPPPIFILQDGSETTRDYARTVIRMDTTMDTFESDGGSARFEATVASELGIDLSDVQVMSIRSGSVIVDYNVYVPRGGSIDDLLLR
jgi:hypothetical protein